MVERHLGPVQSLILGWLADNNGAHDKHGKATTLIADGLGINHSQCSNVVKILAARGFITRDVAAKRTYRIEITLLGREAVGRRAQWSREPAAARPAGRATVTRIDSLSVTCWCEHDQVRVARDDVAKGRTASCGRPGCHPPIPTLGHIDKHPFNPDQARTGAAKGAFT